MQIAIFANPKVLSPRPQLTANSLTSVGGTDACDQLCYWDSKDPWAQCHIIDHLSLLGPSGHFRYCDQLSSTSTDCKFIDFSGWDWCLWSALLLGPKGPLSSAAHCWSSFTTLFFQGVPLVINCLLLASTGPLPAASLGRHASLHYSSCITQVASLKLHYSSWITQVALLKLQYQVAILKLHYSSCNTKLHYSSCILKRFKLHYIQFNWCKHSSQALKWCKHSSQALKSRDTSF